MFLLSVCVLSTQAGDSLSITRIFCFTKDWASAEEEVRLRGTHTPRPTPASTGCHLRARHPRRLGLPPFHCVHAQSGACSQASHARAATTAGRALQAARSAPCKSAPNLPHHFLLHALLCRTPLRRSATAVTRHPPSTWLASTRRRGKSARPWHSMRRSVLGSSREVVKAFSSRGI
jgi:hypothetical protein